MSQEKVTDLVQPKHMSEELNHHLEGKQTYIVSWDTEELSILANNAHAAVKVFKDFYPQAKNHIRVTTFKDQ